MAHDTQNLQHSVLAAVLGKVNDERSIIILTGGFIEFCLARLIEAKLKYHKKILSDTRSYPFSTQLILLNELSLISDKLFRSLDDFRKLRNKAAHDAIFKVSEKDLQNICTHIQIDLKQRSRVNAPQSVFDNPVRMTCLRIILKLFEEHFEILSKSTTPASWHGTA